MKLYLDVLFMDVPSSRGHWLSRIAWWGLRITRLSRPRFVHVMCRYRIVGDDDDDDIYPWVSLSPWGFDLYADDDELALDVRLDTTERISVCLGSVDSFRMSSLLWVDDMLPKFNPQTPVGAGRFYIGAIMTALGISRWSHQFPVCTDPVWWRLCGKVTSYGHLTPDAIRWFINNEIYQVFW